MHDKAGIRLDRDASGWRSKRDSSTSRSVRQPGQKTVSQVYPVIRAAPIVGENQVCPPAATVSFHY